MATIKSYTDLEQSKKLSEILPLESADMFFQLGEGKYADSIKAPLTKKHWEQMMPDINPCWSLAALLDMLKDDIKIEKILFDQSDIFTYSILGDAYEYRTYEHENLIDACVEMICKLHEQKLL